jgi:hypothetical protein
MFGQDGELAHDLRQFTILGRIKRESNFSLSGRLGLDDAAVIS